MAPATTGGAPAAVRGGQGGGGQRGAGGGALPLGDGGAVLELGTALRLGFGRLEALGQVLGARVARDCERVPGIGLRDRGAEAEPDNSGSTSVDVSPGITLGVGPTSTMYAYVQVPVHQKVNGIQLVPRASFVVGWTADF